jgi:uncharacterized membrane protein YoaK (UPF0700 family)
MFRHKGKRRTHKHNLRLAAMLSFVAGIVNITGVLSFKILTTNVTGHFAFFSEELFKKNYIIALTFLIFIFTFLFGAFVSNLIIETVSRKHVNRSHIVPMIIEILVLSIAAFGGHNLAQHVNSNLIPCLLLFAMGLQNSMVTKISDSVVRTTHLTGLFTDLGIELSQLIIHRKTYEFNKISKKVNLRIAIISSFFLGCIIGGFAFKFIGESALFVASVFLLFTLFYDNIRYMIFRIKRSPNFS